MKNIILMLSIVFCFSAWAGPGPDDRPRHQPGPDDVETDWDYDGGRGDVRPDFDDDRAGSGPWDDVYGSRDTGGSAYFSVSAERESQRQYGDRDIELDNKKKRQPQYGENDSSSKQQGDGNPPPQQMQSKSSEPVPGNTAPDSTDRGESRDGVNGPDGWVDTDRGYEGGLTSPDGDYGGGFGAFLRNIFGCSDLLFAPSGA